MMTDVSVVVPVYRSSAILPFLIDRLRAVLAAEPSYEIVLVDDGSPDDSWPALAALQSKFPHHVTAVRLSRNFGQHRALMSGFREATGGIVVTIDDDLQNAPEDIPALLAKVREGNDVAYGTSPNKNLNLWRNLESGVISAFFWAVFHRRPVLSSFRAIRRAVLDRVAAYESGFVYIDGLIALHARTIAEVPVSRSPRPIGESTYSLARRLHLGSRIMASFLIGPARLMALSRLFGRRQYDVAERLPRL